MSSDRRTLLALFAIAFGLRILYAAAIGTDPAMNPSPGTYDYYLAERIHDDTAWISEPFTSQAPVYPLTLAAAFRLLGVRQWVAILLQAFLGAVTTLFLYRIGERRLGRGVGMVSAIWLGISVHHMHFASIFVRDTLVTFALAWLCFTMVRDFQRMRQAVWAGFVYAFLIHVDPQFLILFPVLLLYYAVLATRHRVLNLQYVFLFAATVFVVSLPWTIRNAVVYGEPVPVALEAGRYLKPVTGLLFHDDAGAPGEDELKGTGVMRAHPSGFAQNSIEFWRVTRLRGTEENRERGLRAEPPWSFRHNLINVVNFGVLLPFAAWGALLAFRRRNRAGMAMVLVIATYFLMHAFMGASERIRLPIEPLVILLAFFGFFQMLGMRRSQSAAPEDAA